MTKRDEMAVDVLGNLIENIKSGNIHSLGIEGIPLNNDVVELRMAFQGIPDEKLRLNIVKIG